MTTMVRTHSRAWIAALAGAALVLQAVLTSLTPPGAAAAAAVERLAAYALCIGSPAGRNDAGRPAPTPHPAHQACCILCSVPGLAAAGGVPDLTAPAWGPPLAAPLRQQADPPLVRLADRFPVRARAPPRA